MNPQKEGGALLGPLPLECATKNMISFSLTFSISRTRPDIQNPTTPIDSSRPFCIQKYIICLKMTQNEFRVDSCKTVFFNIFYFLNPTRYSKSDNANRLKSTLLHPKIYNLFENIPKRKFFIFRKKYFSNAHKSKTIRARIPFFAFSSTDLARSIDLTTN